jgi:hypothetical protein
VAILLISKKASQAFFQPRVLLLERVDRAVEQPHIEGSLETTGGGSGGAIVSW